MTKININYRAILKLLGIIILVMGTSMMIPWVYSECTGDISAITSFRKCTPVTIFIGLVLTIVIKTPNTKFRIREGYLLVTICWISASVIGAFPYYLSGLEPTFIDSLFESTSGITTTGCTSTPGGMLSRSLILWKGISNWLGGMGILVFVISILPMLGINGQIIVRAEAPGPTLEKMAFRMSDSAKFLYLTYFSFTIIEFVLLMLSGKIPVFDAVINTLGSISTGGLMVHPTGLAYYNSLYIEIIISTFCILSSANFMLYNHILHGKFNAALKDIEFRAFLIIILTGTIICTFSLFLNADVPFLSALRDSFFQVVSMSTTAGYTRSPYITWPVTCQIVLLTLMLIGGCGSSTSGSIKVIRFLVFIRLIGRGCVKRIHPRSVVAVKIGGNAVSAPTVSGITVFILTYFGVFLLSSLILSFQGLDMETTLTTTIAMLSNTGAAFGETASMGNFSLFHPILKIYLCILMIVGRLELFTIIILFTKNFWGKDS